MKPSIYNIVVDNPDNEEIILFNSLYGSLTVWEPAEFELVESILDNPLQRQGNFLDIWKILVEQKHILPDAVDEISLIEKRKMLGVKDENRLDLIIMPTLECNFSCTYCYEDHRTGKMCEETEVVIKKWLKTQIPNYKVIMLHWFGGEPLIGYKRVVSITKYAARVSADSGVKCVTHITTNGYLLNNKRIKKLINASIYDFQITVDGPPETHDKLRVLRNGKGTFSRLFQNINKLARADEAVKVSLRVNFNHTNINNIPKLLRMFPLDVRPQLRVVYEPIFGDCTLSALDNLQPEHISKTISDYYFLAEQLGYDVVLGKGGINPGKMVYCYAERENQIIINYNGDVFKCSVSTFDTQERVGYINAGGKLIRNNSKWDQWVAEPLFEEHCYECVHLPLCMGGCRKMRLQQESKGSYCSLVPTNTSYILKKVALGEFKNLLIDSAQ